MDQRYCWVDVWAFERIVRQADAVWEKGPTESDAPEAVQLTQKAIDLYQEPFLAAEGGAPWAVPLRERLRSKFLRAVAQLGGHWERVEQWERALECYEEGLELDDIAEESYRRLMVCHQRLGRRAEALSVYGRCKRTLSATLGVEPSAETEAIRKSLLSEKKS